MLTVLGFCHSFGRQNPGFVCCYPYARENDKPGFEFKICSRPSFEMQFDVSLLHLLRKHQQEADRQNPTGNPDGTESKMHGKISSDTSSDRKEENDS